MNKGIIFSILLIFSTFLSSCGSVNLSVKPGAEISRNATLTIAAEDDRSGTVGELNYLLFEKGFNVVSYSTAKEAVRFNSQMSGSDSVNNELESELYSIKELNSIYALELDYTYYYDVFYYAYRSFSARIIDLNTGEIVMSANFRGDKSVRRVLKQFTEKLSEEIY